jgi:hypothetical protein
MENLAGNTRCDRYIRDELTKARIPEVAEVDSRGEVPATVMDKFHGFTFQRAWYYYMVHGDMPLDVAVELHADPLGLSDVRVDGNCMCPPPGPPHHVKYFDANDYQLVPPHPKNDETVIDWASRTDYFHRELVARYDAQYRRVENPADEAVIAVVSSYHIDSLAGLRLFADTIRKHDLYSRHASRNEKIKARQEAAVEALGPKPKE